MQQPTEIGLYDSSGVSCCLLRGVEIDAHLSGFALEATVSQTFINDGDQERETVYTFPLPDGATVCGFEAVTGNRVLTAEIHDAEEASVDYANALEAGGNALLLEQLRPDIFTVNVGRIAPGQAITTRLRYVLDVRCSDRQVRLNFPTTVAPRYIAQQNRLDAFFEDEQLNPPRAGHVPYGVRLHLQVNGLGVSGVSSPSHDLQVGDWSDGVVTLAGGIAETNRDIVLLLDLNTAPLPTARVERGPDEAHYVAVTLQPQFPDASHASGSNSEVYFVLDCSGSMSGTSIASAKLALRLCLRTLAIGDTFNICRFGSRHDFFAPEPVVYSEDTLQAALAYVDASDANYGGTQLQAPLQEIFATATRPDCVREVLLLTDGQVSNEADLIALAGRHRDTHRMFTFGIGSASSQYLVRGLANATSGMPEFIANGEPIEPAVLRTFGRLTAPAARNVRVDWGVSEVTPCSDAPPTLFEGDGVTLLARCAGKLPEQVQISYAVGAETFAGTLPLQAGDQVGPVHKLWAQRRITQASERTVRIGLSKTHGVLCRDTSFLAVEHASLEDRNNGRPALHRVPLMLPEAECPPVMMACLPEPAAAAPPPMELTSPGACAPEVVASGRKLLARMRGSAEPDRFVASLACEVGTADLPLLLDGQLAEGLFLEKKHSDIDALVARIKKEFPRINSTDAQRIATTVFILRRFDKDFAVDQSLWNRAAQKAKGALRALLECDDERLADVFGI